MSAIDITRNLYQPGKRYSAMLQYQGGVALDADANEGQLIQKEALGKVVTDLLCAAGSPDDGLKVGPQVGSGYDFELGAGTFYIGGMRLDIDWPDTFAAPATAESFQAQTDFLLLEDAGAGLANDWLPGGVSAAPGGEPAAERTDFVWLEAFEQAVTGIEDGETIEAALGVDVSARLRPTRRVHVMTDTPDDCADAFDALKIALEAGGKSTYRPDDALLKSNRRLEVGFDLAAATADPCDPPSRTGYQWAENDTIQVRVIAPDRFVWAINNAAPIYRAAVAASDELVLAAEPRDETLRPLAGDVIEVLRAGAMLPNGEVIAEPHGHFYRVDTGYEPSTRKVVVAGTPNLLNLADDDDARITALATDYGVDEPGSYVFVRLWRGATIASGSSPGLAIDSSWIQLGDSGVRVRFSGDGPVGDYWTFSVRPNTPDIIVPWGLERPSPPTGPKRHIAGLGLIRWKQPAAGGIEPEFHDCRHKIRKLCERTSCCEITVGDGHVSFGDVDSIAAAVALLPTGGGKICLLKGEHEAPLLLIEKTNITVEGCGRLTKLIAPAGYSGPLVEVSDSTHITLRNFMIDAPASVGVSLKDSYVDTNRAMCRDLRLSTLWFQTRDAEALRVDGVAGLKIVDCSVRLLPFEGGRTAANLDKGLESAFLIFGRRIEVRNCSIGPTLGDDDDDELEVPDLPAMHFPAGGIKLLGGCAHVELRHNRIFGGSSTGILLGSVLALEGIPTVAEGEIIFVESSEGYASTSMAFVAQPTGWVEIAETNVGGLYGTSIPNSWSMNDLTIGPEDYFNTTVVPGLGVNSDGCWEWDPTPTPDPDPGEPGSDVPPRLVAGPPIDHLIIDDNEIAYMGESGISATAFFEISIGANGFGQYCAVSDCRITNNRIIGCARNEPRNLDRYEYVDSGRGGIALGFADTVLIAENLIEGCGTRHSGPICGIFAVHLVQALIVNNIVTNNGLRITDAGDDIKLGQRGGIVIRFAMPQPDHLLSPMVSKGMKTKYGVDSIVGYLSQGLGEAVAIRGNHVVTPEGRSLDLLAMGSVAVSDNELTSLGNVQATIISSFFAGAGGGIRPGIAELAAANSFTTLFGSPSIYVNALAPGEGPHALGPPNISNHGRHWRGFVNSGTLSFQGNRTHFSPPRTLPYRAWDVVSLLASNDAHVADNLFVLDAFTSVLQDVFHMHVWSYASHVRMLSNRMAETRETAMSQFLSGFALGSSGMQRENVGDYCYLLHTGTFFKNQEANFSLLYPIDGCRQFNKDWWARFQTQAIDARRAMLKLLYVLVGGPR